MKPCHPGKMAVIIVVVSSAGSLKPICQDDSTAGFFFKVSGQKKLKLK